MCMYVFWVGVSAELGLRLEDYTQCDQGMSPVETMTGRTSFGSRLFLRRTSVAVFKG